MKFSTDVLLIAPAVMGVIFSISRIWDAVSDPVAGYLSDRTTFKFGRRRTWILVSFVPISLGFLAVFSPPAIERLSAKGLFEKVIVTNSIPVKEKDLFQQLKVLSVANMLGEAIWRIHEESSISSMFR